MSDNPRTIEEARKIIYSTIMVRMMDMRDQAKREADKELDACKSDTIDFHDLPLIVTVSIRRAEEWLRKS